MTLNNLCVLILHITAYNGDAYIHLQPFLELSRHIFQLIITSGVGQRRDNSRLFHTCLTEHFKWKRTRYSFNNLNPKFYQRVHFLFFPLITDKYINSWVGCRPDSMDLGEILAGMIKPGLAQMRPIGHMLYSTCLLYIDLCMLDCLSRILGQLDSSNDEN